MDPKIYIHSIDELLKSLNIVYDPRLPSPKEAKARRYHIVGLCQHNPNHPLLIEHQDLLNEETFEMEHYLIFGREISVWRKVR